MADQNSNESTSEAGDPVDEPVTIPIERVEREKSEPTASPSGASPTAKLEADLAAAQKEKQETYDRLLRTAADFDNYRKRARKELEDARLKAREDVLRDILPVLDNLDRALVHAQEPTASVNHVVDGVKLVLRQFEGALERAEVKGFQTVGQPFDPTRHEAVSQIETAEHPPGVVAVEMQRGFTIGSRLLRPALVAVAKSPAEKSAPAEPEASEGS